MNSLKRKRVIETLILYGGYVGIGISFSIIGPTLPDLQEITHSRTDEISIVLMIRNIGGIAGAVFCGFLIRNIDPWILAAVTSGLSGILEMCVPLCTSLVPIGIIFTLDSFFTMVFDSLGSMLLIKIWGNDHDSWMQALHCLFGIGTLIGPLIAMPFLSSTEEADTTVNHTNSPNTSLTMTTEEKDIQVKYAYFIAGGFLILSSLANLALYLQGPRTCFIKMDKEDKGEESQIMKEGKTFFICFVTLTFMFYWMYCTMELMYGNYLATYVIQALGWSKSDGASLTSVFWGIFTFGRILGIFGVNYVSVEMLLLCTTSLSIVALLPEVFFSHAHFSILWIFTAAFGFVISPIYASGMTFANKYIPVSGGVGSIFVAAGSLGGVTGPLLVLNLFDSYGMEVFTPILLTASVLLFLIFVVSYFIGKKHGIRNNYSIIESDHDETSTLIDK